MHNLNILKSAKNLLEKRLVQSKDFPYKKNRWQAKGKNGQLKRCGSLLFAKGTHEVNSIHSLYHYNELFTASDSKNTLQMHVKCVYNVHAVDLDSKVI